MTWFPGISRRMRGSPRRRVAVQLKVGVVLTGFARIDDLLWGKLRAAAALSDPVGWASALASPDLFAQLPPELEMLVITEGASIEESTPVQWGKKVMVPRMTIARIFALME
jgi:hypothetical protein